MRSNYGTLFSVIRILASRSHYYNFKIYTLKTNTDMFINKIKQYIK